MVNNPQPQLYVVNLSTGEVTGGPGGDWVQHYNRETAELTVHRYDPDGCARCAEIRHLAATHSWQEYNAYGNTCHYPGCTLAEEEHATFQRPALRPGEGQHDCFLADRCVGDPRCEVASAACEVRR